MIVTEVYPWTGVCFRPCAATESTSDLDVFVLWLHRNAHYDEVV